jgi:hypothetical protein
MSKIPISIRLEEETINLLKVAAMQEALRRGNYDLNYINLIEEAIHEAYDESLFKEAKVKISENAKCLKNIIKKNKNNGKIELVNDNTIDKAFVDSLLGSK